MTVKEWNRAIAYAEKRRRQLEQHHGANIKLESFKTEDGRRGFNFILLDFNNKEFESFRTNPARNFDWMRSCITKTLVDVRHALGT